jgi:hypothetical protein
MRATPFWDRTGSTWLARLVAVIIGFAACLVWLRAQSAESEPTAKDNQAADLLRGYRSDVVLIKGKTGAGSGFVLNQKGRKFLASNAHVLAGIRSPTFTTLDRTPIKLKPGSALVAVGHDILLFEVQESGNGIPVMDAFAGTVAINDPIAVCGNTGGSDVATLIKGKVVGIGPDRIEISAEIERGNSGSPILHLPSGKAIGVAAYVTREEVFSGENKVRRFGYRLDSVKQWQPVEWARFYAEADKLEKIETTTSELAHAFLELNGLNQRTNKVRKFAYDSPAIRSALDDFYGSLEVRSHREADRVVDNLLGNLRGVSQGDVTSLKTTFTYDCFRRRYAEQQEARTEIMNLIVKVLRN